MILSESMMVWSLWATVSTVQLWNLVRIVSWINASVLVSLSKKRKSEKNNISKTDRAGYSISEVMFS